MPTLRFRRFDEIPPEDQEHVAFFGRGYPARLQQKQRRVRFARSVDHSAAFAGDHPLMASA